MVANINRLVHRLVLRKPRIFRDRTNPLDMYDDFELYDRFRFRRRELIEIIEEFSGPLEYLATRQGSLPASLQILIAIRFFATGSFQLTIGDLFGVSKSTVHLCIKRVSDAISSKLDKHVHLPGQQEADRTKGKFHAMANMPCVIGCVDGTQVKIQRPTQNEYQFVNRKGYHSLNVQLVCDADMLILHCVVKWPGSVHDARMLKESGLFRAFEQIPPPLNGIFLGDSGYMLKHWLLTPYLNPTTCAQERYNMAHTSTRVTIERCNGVLKRRWHCLHGELRYSPARACQIIKSCIVLHNKAIRDKVPLLDDDTDDSDDDDDPIVLDDRRADVRARLLRDRIAAQYFEP